ncbi:MAG: branched chain amino acid aminotransferase, partial [Candidatus Amulumruptor sp.]|nr:branched chain amino acid aminotransferase [Candidatus Amulumruptor sp.]
MTLAEDMGIKVERRQIPVEELAEVDEAGECGTAAVASPVAEIHDIDNNIKYVVAKDGEPGPVTTKLYNRLRGIQLGEEPDVHGWCTIVE